MSRAWHPTVLALFATLAACSTTDGPLPARNTTVPATEAAGVAESPTARPQTRNSVPNPGSGAIRTVSHTSENPVPAGKDSAVPDWDPPGQDESEERDRQAGGNSESSDAAEPPERQEPQQGEEFGGILTLQEVVTSITADYPLLQAAFQEREIATGSILQAQGAFDLKLKAGTEDRPIGFYRTYRHFAGAEQPLYSGADVFAGYRIGRGSFEPWYQERLTDDGGEFKAGVRLPIVRNRDIDERRAELWQSVVRGQAVEPAIRQQLLKFVRAGSFAYWEWVAAGAVYRVQKQLLDLALNRLEGLEKQIEAGDLPEITRTDNQRLIASRRAKLIEAERKLRQAAVKLSLFLRTPDGRPFVPPDAQLPGAFPETMPVDDRRLEDDIRFAWDNRPELRDLALQRQELEIQLA